MTLARASLLAASARATAITPVVLVAKRAFMPSPVLRSRRPNKQRNGNAAVLRWPVDGEARRTAAVGGPPLGGMPRPGGRARASRGARRGRAVPPRLRRAVVRSRPLAAGDRRNVR